MLNKKKKIIVSGILLLLLIGMVFISDWFWNALSPVLHKDLLYKYAGEFKIDPLLIAAIIKCESTFNPIATSKKGAKGLMQMMPETAEELAHELNIDYVNEDELYKPEVNIQFGFYYITKLQKQYNGNLIFTLAAYNAGTKKTNEWVNTYKGEGDDEVLEKITFPETREFIRKVLRTYGVLKFVRKLKRTLQLRD